MDTIAIQLSLCQLWVDAFVIGASAAVGDVLRLIRGASPGFAALVAV